MAEGFLGQPNEGVNMEALGNEYFDELLSRSFFQRKTSHLDDFLRHPRFVLHDLINDLAKYMSGEFCRMLESEVTCNSVERARHVSYLREQLDTTSSNFAAILEAKSLRTFLACPINLMQRGTLSTLIKHMQLGMPSSFDNKVLCELLSKLTWSKVLSLSGYGDIVELPDSIGQLKYLRYLDLSETSIKRLPHVVGCLYYLQILLLQCCLQLTVLPDSIGNLKYLEYISIVEIPIRKLPESASSLCNLQTLTWSTDGKFDGDVGLYNRLEEMPLEISKLKRLRKLNDFMVGKKSGGNLKQLGELNLLVGELCVWDLQNISSGQDALEANLENKDHLKTLVLMWGQHDETSSKSFDVLKHLKPHRNLERLRIDGYRVKTFPDWIGDASVSNMIELKLKGCHNCTCLPQRGQLPSLKRIAIVDCPLLDSLPERGLLPNLEQLQIESCKTLVANRLQWNLQSFPSLLRFFIRSCDELGAFPEEMLLPSTLTSLRINGFGSLTSLNYNGLQHLPSLTELFIFGCPNLQSLHLHWNETYTCNIR